jgi:hypothetical protein
VDAFSQLEYSQLNPKIMKTHLSNKTLRLSLLSVITVCIFILFAIGSAIPLDEAFNIPETKLRPLGNGLFEETFFTASQKRITTGRRDAQNNWTGEVTIKWSGGAYGGYTEECTMIEGNRWGWSTRKFDGNIWYSEYEEVDWYVDNMRMPRFKAANGGTADTSSFQVLGNKYTWFLFSLNAYGFDSIYVEAFLDTLETLLNTYEFEVTAFDDYYGHVLDSLEDTPFDSIITLNSNLLLYQGLQEIKKSELRLAVIDRYRSEGNTTYNIVNTTYPHYLHSLNDSGVINQDFEGFCQDLDSCMTSYEALDPEDPFFVDSVDARMFRALWSILNTEESSSSSSELLLKSTVLANKSLDFRGIYHKVNFILRSLYLKSTSSEVALVVVSGMLKHFIEGDIIRQAAREAWFIKKGVVRPPTAATEFSNNNSATSVTLKGNVMEDGGAAVTSRGIAWAVFYNPTVNDNSVTSETGTGEFTVNLTGLTEGTKYYARTYATNSAGTAYGNCIGFVAATPTDIADNKVFTQVFTIYPNPASAITTFSFLLESSESLVLNVLDIKGQRVLFHDLGRLPQGVNQIDLNLSGLKDGMYNCQLTNGTTKVTRKLVIAH